ncbi:TPA: virulence factor MviN, partial [Klebsiella pneumoniae subsp. pneumoniae]|nr:virulence factor MviN [Klebsiella pneumoniae subsp. pneumoniae]
EVISNFWVTLRPLILLPFIYQGNIATERAIATLISITAVSALDYAKFITETLLLVVSTPVALAGLATWGGMAKEEIRDKLAVTFELLLIVSVPFSLFLGGFSKDIVTVLFARGQFDSLSIDVTSNILLGMSFGLWAYVIGYVLIKGLNAQLKNKAVLVIMSISLIGNILFNIIAYKYFKETTLGIAYSISGILMCFCCVYNLQLWKDVKNTIFYMSIGAMIYLLMIFFKFHSDKQIVSLILNGLFFIFYWVSFISVISPLREKALTILRRKNKHNVK